MRFHSFLPPQERPEYTEGYEGFYYLSFIKSDCEEGEARYILRDHSQEKMQAKIDLAKASARLVNEEFGSEVLSVEVVEQYRNMAEVVTKPENKHLIDNARRAYKKIGVDMKFVPMRGGTDGSQLSFRGFAAPNLSACYYNAHGVREFVPVPELEAMVDMLVELCALYATPQTVND